MFGMLLMTKETIGQRITRLRKLKGLSKYRLAKLSGVNESYIYLLEKDGVVSPRGDTLLALAKGLGVPMAELAGEVKKSLENLVGEVVERYEALEQLEIPLRGTVPAGYPFPVDQEPGEYVEVSRHELGGIAPQTLYGLKIGGDSLQGDEIYQGDTVIVNSTDLEVVDGKIYIIRLGDEVCARHIFHQGDRLKLASSNGQYKEIEATEVEILGRVILSGRWKRH